MATKCFANWRKRFVRVLLRELLPISTRTQRIQGPVPAPLARPGKLQQRCLSQRGPARCSARMRKTKHHSVLPHTYLLCTLTSLQPFVLHSARISGLFPGTDVTEREAVLHPAPVSSEQSPNHTEWIATASRHMLCCSPFQRKIIVIFRKRLSPDRMMQVI